MLPAAVMGGASLLTSWLGSRASNQAANIQNQAGQQAANASMLAGQNAVGGINAATAAAQQAAQQGYGQGLEAIQGGANQANQTLAALLAQATGNQSAYMGAGNQAIQNLSQMFAPGGAATQQFNFSGEDFRNTPGYQFALEEGQRAIERSAAARGAGPLSGGTLRALTRYSQGVADQGFGDAFNRARSTFQMNRENMVNPALALAQLGQGATQNVNALTASLGGQQAQNTFDAGRMGGQAQMNLAELLGQYGIRGAETAGRFGMGAVADANDALMGGANARAAGRVGSANAWNQGISGVANSLGGWLAQRDMRRRTPFAGYADEFAYGGRP